MIWYPDDEDEPDGDASANATSSISLHVTSRSGTWEWTATFPDDDGDDPHVLMKGCGLKSLDDAKATAETVLRRWLARQVADLEAP